MTAVCCYGSCFSFFQQTANQLFGVIIALVRVFDGIARFGISTEEIREHVTFIHTYKQGTLVLSFLDGSVEGSDEDMVRICTIESKKTGADIHAIGDAGLNGMSVPEVTRIINISKNKVIQEKAVLQISWSAGRFFRYLNIFYFGKRNFREKMMIFHRVLWYTVERKLRGGMPMKRILVIQGGGRPKGNTAPPLGRYEKYPDKDCALLMTSADNLFWTFEQAVSYYRFRLKRQAI